MPTPYKKQLAALTNSAEFKAITGNGINRKLNLIRKAGNSAVHGSRTVRPDVALAVLRETAPCGGVGGVPSFDRPGGSPHQDTVRSADRCPSRTPVIRGTDEARRAGRGAAAELAEKDEIAAAKDAEIAKLREQVKAVQAANQLADDHDYAEADTRDLFIDVLLGEAGWGVVSSSSTGEISTNPIGMSIEYKVTGMPSSTGAGHVDYVLWGADGLPLAVVEAKRTTKSAQLGQQQAKLYAHCLEAEFGRRPVIFYTNGYEHWLWDDAAGHPPREVLGFYTRDELELLIQRRTT